MNVELDSDELLKILQGVQSDSEYDMFVQNDEPEEDDSEVLSISKNTAKNTIDTMKSSAAQIPTVKKR